VIKLGDPNKSEDQEQAEGNETPKETKKSKTAGDLVKTLADQAWELAGCGTTVVRILIYCDRREDAKKVHENLLKRTQDQLKPQVTKAKGEKAKEHEARVAELARDRIELFVGARRVQEREEARKRLEEMGFLAGSQAPSDGPRFLVATSAGEVGVDLDADHMVCDLVPWDRMVQRFGRVNRRGGSNAQVCLVVEPLPQPNKREKAALDKPQNQRSDKDKKAIAGYEKKCADRKAHLAPFEHESALPRNDDESLTISPAALSKLMSRAATDDALRKVLSEAVSKQPLRPALTRPLVDAWSMTSLKEHTGRPRIEPWLRGWVEDEPQTSVVWRMYLPVRSGKPATKREIEDFLETETRQVWSWLTKRIEKLIPKDKARKALDQETWEAEASEEPDAEAEPEDIESAEKATEESPGIEEEEHANNAADATADDAQNHTATAQQAAASAETFEADEVVAIVLSPSGDYVRSLRACDILFASQTTNDKARKKKVSRAKERITDALSGTTLIVSARLGGLRNGLLDDACEETAKTADGPESWGQDEKGNPFIRFRVRVLENGAVETASQPQDKWREALRFDLERNADGEPTKQLLIEEWPDVENTEDRRSNGPPQTLVEHQSWTECAARKIAKRLKLDQDYSCALAIAARLHDEGKRADRWQRAFRAPRNGGPYAKVNKGINQALLDGYRHEFGSLPYAEEHPDFQKLPGDLQDLVLHLIAAHHGQARPVIETRGCDGAPPSVLEERARDVALRFARLQRRWGPWGLAWWEALLRAADQQASRENERRVPSNNKGGN
jgi:CRISPR-associated endonuclease/helicase Cas3